MPVWWNAYTLRLERSAGRIGGSSPSTGTNTWMVQPKEYWVTATVLKTVEA